MLLLTNGMWEVITPTRSGAETVFQTCAVVISHIIPISWFPHYLNVYLYIIYTYVCVCKYMHI